MKKAFKGLKLRLKSKTFRAGGYSLAAAVIVIAIAVTVNLVMHRIPSRYTQFDLTDNQMFTLSQQSLDIVGTLDSDINIYWLVQTGMEDSYVQRMLDVYSGMNSHLNVVKIDPVLYPNFTSNYTDSTLYDNSLIVECGDRSKTVSIFDIYAYDYY